MTNQVVSQQLHDQCGVLVALLAQSVKLGDGIIEGLFGEVAGLVGRVQDLIVEDGEVQGKTKSDRVGWGKISLGNLSGGLIGLERLVGRFLSLVGNGKLSQVTVVIALPGVKVSACLFAGAGSTSDQILHLVVEDLGFARLSRRNQVLVENVEDVLADLPKLFLDLLTVFLDELDLSLIALGLFLLLDRRDDSPRGTAGTDDVLVGDGQEISLLDRELLVRRGNNFHVLNHF